RLVEQHPTIQLAFCNYSLSGLEIPDHIKARIQTSYELASKYPKNVINLGSLTKQDLYRELAKTSLLLYPTNFPEISCIAAMEAQAFGVPVISTDDFALRETVINGESGILIPGLPGTEEYD